MGGGGTVELLVDGVVVVGTGTIDRTTPCKYSLSENQDIGTPVTYDYRTPFDFQGRLDQVVVELQP